MSLSRKTFPLRHGKTRNTEGSIQPQNTNGTAFVKFQPTSGTDSLMNGRTNINTKLQCITGMKEYEAESLEELRLEDYLKNKKGSQAGISASATTAQPSNPFAATLTYFETSSCKPSPSFFIDASNHPTYTSGQPSKCTAPQTSPFAARNHHFRTSSPFDASTQQTSIFGPATKCTTPSTGHFGACKTLDLGQSSKCTTPQISAFGASTQQTSNPGQAQKCPAAPNFSIRVSNQQPVTFDQPTKCTTPLTGPFGACKTLDLGQSSKCTTPQIFAFGASTLQTSNPGQAQKCPAAPNFSIRVSNQQPVTFDQPTKCTTPLTSPVGACKTLVLGQSSKCTTPQISAFGASTQRTSNPGQPQKLPAAANLSFRVSNQQPVTFDQSTKCTTPLTGPFAACKTLVITQSSKCTTPQISAFRASTQPTSSKFTGPKTDHRVASIPQISNGKTTLTGLEPILQPFAAFSASSNPTTSTSVPRIQKISNDREYMSPLIGASTKFTTSPPVDSILPVVSANEQALIVNQSESTLDAANPDPKGIRRDQPTISTDALMAYIKQKYVNMSGQSRLTMKECNDILAILEGSQAQSSTNVGAVQSTGNNNLNLPTIGQLNEENPEKKNTTFGDIPTEKKAPSAFEGPPLPRYTTSIESSLIDKNENPIPKYPLSKLATNNSTVPEFSKANTSSFGELSGSEDSRKERSFLSQLQSIDDLYTGKLEGKPLVHVRLYGATMDQIFKIKENIKALEANASLGERSKETEGGNIPDAQEFSLESSDTQSQSSDSVFKDLQELDKNIKPRKSYSTEWDYNKVLTTITRQRSNSFSGEFPQKVIYRPTAAQLRVLENHMIR